MEPRRSKLRKDKIYGPKQEVYRKNKEEIHLICGKVNYCPAAEDKINSFSHFWINLFLGPFLFFAQFGTSGFHNLLEYEVIRGENERGNKYR